MRKEKLLVLTGAGMSADSGISTFRDSGGLWENVDVMEVASIEGWHQNPERVLDFYNERRRQLQKAEPHAGHLALKKLEMHYEVTIVTQNIDNLHERAGSTHVVHLHGELTKARSVDEKEQVIEIGYSDIKPGDCNEQGQQLRPHVVWFGEQVPMMEVAAHHVMDCDVMMVIGTSLAVYPAAGLVNLAQPGIPIYVIDPQKPEFPFQKDITYIQETAIRGVPKMVDTLTGYDQANAGIK